MTALGYVSLVPLPALCMAQMANLAFSTHWPFLPSAALPDPMALHWPLLLKMKSIHLEEQTFDLNEQTLLPHNDIQMHLLHLLMFNSHLQTEFP